MCCKFACMHIQLSFLVCFVAVATAKDVFPPLGSGMDYSKKKGKQGKRKKNSALIAKFLGHGKILVAFN